MLLLLSVLIVLLPIVVVIFPLLLLMFLLSGLPFIKCLLLAIKYFLFLPLLLLSPGSGVSLCLLNLLLLRLQSCLQHFHFVSFSLGRVHKLHDDTFRHLTL